MIAPYHCIRFGPSSFSGTNTLSFFRNIPTFAIASPMFGGRLEAILLLTIFAILGPFPFVLTII